MKKTIEEIRDYLIKNRTNEDGDLDLADLDFSGFDGNVDISGMKVKYTLLQDHQEVGFNLWQDNQEVGEDLFQDYQEVGRNLFQANQKVVRKLYQDNT
jgi:hypothetical protein